MQPNGFEIPEQIRDMGDRSVEQARKALEQFLDAAQKAVVSAEGSARSLSDGAADVNRQTLAFFEENIVESFDLAHQLVQARTVQEMTDLQQAFLRRQMSSAADRGKQLSEMIGRYTSAAAKTATNQAD